MANNLAALNLMASKSRGSTVQVTLLKVHFFEQNLLLQLIWLDEK